MASHIAEDDGKLVSADRTPNMRGAFVTGLVSEYPAPALDALAREIRAGEVKTVLCFREDLKSLGLDSKDFKSANVIYCGALENRTSESAKNLHSAAQRVREGRAVDKPPVQGAEIRARGKSARRQRGRNRAAFGAYAQIANESFKTPTVRELRELMASRIAVLRDCADVGDSGVLIDSSDFAGIKFPEAAALHFEPSK